MYFSEETAIGSYELYLETSSKFRAAALKTMGHGIAPAYQQRSLSVPHLTY
jgi:hypothetical protein